VMRIWAQICRTGDELFELLKTRTKTGLDSAHGEVTFCPTDDYLNWRYRGALDRTAREMSRREDINEGEESLAESDRTSRTAKTGMSRTLRFARQLRGQSPGYGSDLDFA